MQPTLSRPTPAEAPRAPARWLRALPVVVLLVGLAMTAATAWMLVRGHHNADRERFKLLTERMAADMVASVENAARVQRAAAAFFRSSEQVTPQEFRSYWESIADQVAEGTEGIGYIRRVPRGDVRAVEAEMRAAGLTNFRIQPGGEGPLAYLVTLFEPYEFNTDVPGRDLTTGNTRRAAAESAMRSGTTALSGRIRIIAGPSGQRAIGFLLFTPHYAPGEPTTTPEQRERALCGWVYSSLAAEPLLNTAARTPGSNIAFHVHDGDAVTAETLLAASPDFDFTASTSAPAVVPPPTLEREVRMFVSGRPWTFVFRATSEFSGPALARENSGVLAGGCALSLLAAALVWSLQHARSRALRLAATMTEDLRRAERDSHRLALVASRTSDSVVVTDVQRRIQWVNDGFVRLTGYTLEEARGRHPGELLHGPGTDHAAIQRMRAELKANRGFKAEVMNYNRRHESYWVELEVQPLSDDAGALAGWMAISRDVTARRRAEDAIASRESLQRQILDCVPIGVRIVRVEDGVTTHMSNPAHERITGVREENSEEPGIFLRHTHPDDVPRQLTLRHKLEQKEAERVTLEKRYVHTDGRVVWTRNTWVRRWLPDDRGYEEVCAIVDMTEERAKTAELHRAVTAAEQASHAKSSFLAMMSHEIRTPMNGVIGMTSLLLETDLSSEQRGYVETVRASGDSLLSVINDILDFSKIESGRLELEASPLSLRESIEAVFDLLAPRTTTHNLDLLYAIDDDVPALVLGDVSRLRQILTNLVGNAVKFTARGEIELHISNGEPLGEGSRELHFTVRDTGVGIAPEGQTRLFQPFSQVDASTTRRFGGTGLGLAISRRLAEAMGGRMWVESELGHGSTFHFTIQVRMLNEPLPPLGTAGENELRGKRVLFVDDNAAARRLVSKQLEAWGLAVRAAASPHEALGWLQAGETFDCALLDLRLPDMDGVALARAIRQMPERPAPPIVLLTSLTERTFVDPALFAAYLPKPIKPQYLRDSLVRAMLPHHAAPLAVGRNVVTVETVQPAGPDASRVLVVDDSATNRQIGISMLRRLGRHADIAVNGREAVECVRRAQYDVVLMDLQMPEMDGLEATRLIRRMQREHEPRPWIVALTANAMMEDRERCQAAGMDDFLAKPIKLDDLRAALARVPVKARGASVG